MKVKFLVSLIALSGCVVSSASASYSCDSVLQEYAQALDASDPYFYDPEEAAWWRSNYPQCFGGSSTTSNSQISATAFTQASSISRAIAARLNPFSSRPAGPQAALGTGIAAGNIAPNINFWANIDQNNTDFDYTNAAATKTKGANGVRTAVLGGDYALKPDLVLGLSAAFDDASGWGKTGGGVRNNNSTDGYLFAPYVGYQINQTWAVDASMGWGQGKFSAAGGVKAEADRFFAAANLNYARWLDNWQLTGKLSYLHGNERYGNTKVNGVVQANTKSKNSLDQLRLGVQAGYWMNGVMPYAGIGYTSNVRRSSTNGSDPLGRDALIATLGVNFFSLSSKVTGGLFYEHELNRSNSDNQVFSANINFRF